MGRAVVDEQPVNHESTRTVGIRAVASSSIASRSSTPEQRLLRRVVEHRDDDLVVQGGGAGDDVEMAVGHRVERTGADDPADHSEAHATLLIRVLGQSGGPAARPD